ncbi:hypothetical protein [Gaetbulibacter aestuarii]|uniref:Glycoside hydrolase family 42 N-terminal domain-containing protein n=1 Tax=Gaetbulibacter aestuarii TaxID=1502358 RepID=A0ABW7N1J1_9FLAO
MKRLLKLTAIVLVFFAACSMMFMKDKPRKKDWAAEINNYNYVIGTQTVGSKYKFSEKTMLVETALEIKNMGSNLLKFSMNPRYCTENYGLPKNDKIQSLTDLATLEPSVKEVLDMDFKYYHIWTYCFSQYTPEPPGTKDDTAQIKFIDGFPKKYQEALYKEIFEFTTYLLTHFEGSGKVFYLGNWEGDWHLRPDYDRDKPVNPKTLKGMIKWAQIRQKAIDDAKQATQHSNVEVYHYIEANLVRKAINNSRSKVVANSVIKAVNPDYVSYSSYDSTNPYKTEASLNKHLKESLSFLESQLTPKEGLPAGRRVWIGEYGNPSNNYDDDEQNRRSVWTIKASLEWGTPFILYWEMYNNEIKPNTGEQVGYWLITDKGKKQPIWYTHNEFYKEAKHFIKNYVEDHNKLPDYDTFRKHALKFKSLSL